VFKLSGVTLNKYSELTVDGTDRAYTFKLQEVNWLEFSETMLSNQELISISSLKKGYL
jgi:hypothetical protein